MARRGLRVQVCHSGTSASLRTRTKESGAHFTLELLYLRWRSPMISTWNPWFCNFKNRVIFQQIKNCPKLTLILNWPKNWDNLFCRFFVGLSQRHCRSCRLRVRSFVPPPTWGGHFYNRLFDSVCTSKMSMHRTTTRVCVSVEAHYQKITQSNSYLLNPESVYNQCVSNTN